MGLGERRFEMGEGGGGEELSPFFASIFSLSPETPDTKAMCERRNLTRHPTRPNFNVCHTFFVTPPCFMPNKMKAISECVKF